MTKSLDPPQPHQESSAAPPTPHTEFGVDARPFRVRPAPACPPFQSGKRQASAHARQVPVALRALPRRLLQILGGSHRWKPPAEAVARRERGRWRGEEALPGSAPREGNFRAC